MKSVLAKQDDGTIQLTIMIPAKDVTVAVDSVVEETVKNTDIPGFRKGKAPRKVVEENINKQAVKEEALKKLLPKAYMEAVQEHKLRPIMNPKIHIEKLNDGEDWSFQAVTCEMPDVDLGKYKDAVTKLTAKSKIIVPGKEPEKPKFEEIVQAVLDNAIMKVPSVLVEQEADRLLAQTLDEIKRLGLTLDQYLASTGKSPEQLRAEYAQKAASDVKLEFVLQKIAATEKITVEDKEVEEAIAKAKDPKERENLSQNRYLLTNILRQQKTLDFLRTL